MTCVKIYLGSIKSSRIQMRLIFFPIKLVCVLIRTTPPQTTSLPILAPTVSHPSFLTGVTLLFNIHLILEEF